RGFLRGDETNLREAREVLRVKGKQRHYAVHGHRGDDPRVVGVLAFHIVLRHEALPLLEYFGRVEQNRKRALQLQEFRLRDHCWETEPVLLEWPRHGHPELEQHLWHDAQGLAPIEQNVDRA